MSNSTPASTGKESEMSSETKDATEATPRHVLSEDGTYWIDTQTGLMAAAEESPVLTHDEAVKYCQDLRLGGFADWVMPTLLQEESHRDTDRYNPALPPGWKSSSYINWTSTETAWSKEENRTGSSRSFFVVRVDSGCVDDLNAYHRFRVRPVRVGGAARPGQ